MALSLYPTKLTEEHLQNGFPEHWAPELKQTVKLWLRELQSGMHPLTPRTIQTFRERFIRYTFSLQKELGLGIISVQDCLAVKYVYAIISTFPVESYSNRHNTFYSVHSLARFLIRMGDLEEDYLAQLKKFRPKRAIPPKRTVLRDLESLEDLRAAIQPEAFKHYWSYLIVKTVIELLVQTGLRNAEVCNLKLEDVDLENRRILVHLGKGRKSRQVGISKSLLPHLEEYLSVRLSRSVDTPFFLLNTQNGPFHPTSMGRVIQKVSRLSGKRITTHGLRRTFATLNAEQGRPLHMIQLALGHSDIRTTQEYLMTDQEAVIEAMQDW